MRKPEPSDFIDIHNHNAVEAAGIFTVENLMVHEDRTPSPAQGMVYSCGIHPWFLNEENSEELIGRVRSAAESDDVVAIGEAGFDRLKGPSSALQQKVFYSQVSIAEEKGKPVFIHCVKAWDELLLAHKELRPHQPWMVHGFRGNVTLAKQLLSRNMYLSFWFDFVIRPEAAPLLQSLPSDRIFLETDGSGSDIRDIYRKVAGDLGISTPELQSVLFQNYLRLIK